MGKNLNLDDIQRRFDEYLTMSSLQSLLDKINDSLHSRNILEGVVMILGHRICSDRTLHIVLNKKSTISRIKKWNKCRLNKAAIKKIKIWMLYRPETFSDSIVGFKGADKLLNTLRDWCLAMIIKRKKYIKTTKIQTKTQQIQCNETKKQIEIKSDVQPPKLEKETMNTSNTKIPNLQKKEIVEKSNDKKRTNEKQEPVSNQILRSVLNPNADLVPIDFLEQHKKRMQRIERRKIEEEKNEINNKAIDASVAMNDKAIGVKMESNLNAVGIQTIENNDGLQRLQRLRNTVHSLNDKMNGHTEILLETQFHLDAAKDDLKKLKKRKRNKSGYLLKQIERDQDRLQWRLKSTQRYF